MNKMLLVAMVAVLVLNNSLFASLLPKPSGHVNN